MKKLFLFLTLSIWLFLLIPSSSGQLIACTQEAKLCPDWKTYVWRVAPTCEFKACPDSLNSSFQCPVYSIIAPKDWCKYTYKTDENWCQVIWDIFCEKDYLQIPELEAKNLYIPNLSTVKKWYTFKVYSTISVKWLNQGNVVPLVVKLRNNKWTLLQSCYWEPIKTTKDTSSDWEEYIKKECEITYFKYNSPDLWENYSFQMQLDEKNIIIEQNENNNFKSVVTKVWEEVDCLNVYSPICWEILTNSCPDWAYCIQSEKLIKKTFWNKCELEKAWAKYLYAWECKTEEPEVFCTQETKLCSDWKTYVSRVAPTCEFKACPVIWYELSDSLKKRVNETIEKLAIKLDRKYNDNNDKIIHIWNIIAKLDNIRWNTNSEVIVALIEYIIAKLDQLRTKYNEDDFWDIFDILN